MDEDSLLEKINEFKTKAKEDAETQYQRIIKALENIRVQNNNYRNLRKMNMGWTFTREIYSRKGVI